MIDLKEDQTLDCKGLNCPLPILRTKKVMDTMNVGEVLKMLATDPGSVNDVKSWTKRTGNELLSYEEEDGVFTFFMKKT